MLCQDDFPQEESKIPNIRDRVDWERPESINWSLWQKAIESFKDDTAYLILEGLFIFRPEAGVEPDLAIYLSMDKDRFLAARKQETRWGYEPDWYIEHVWDSHFQYGLPPASLAVKKFENLTKSDYPSILAQLNE